VCFCFCLFSKNHDKAEPRELAGEPNTAAVGFLAFAGGTEGKGQKDKGAAMRKAEEQQKT
jgi:hypothetical protein